MPVSGQPRDVIAVTAFRELIKTFGLVERVMQPYFARHGISGAQWGVLRLLHRGEQEGQSGVRATTLSERLLIRPPSVTGVVDRLVRAGLVAREVDPSDQRARFVRLTNAGRQMVDRVLAGHQRQIESAMGGLTWHEQARLHRLLQRLGRHLEGLANNRGLPLEAQS